MFKDRGVKIVMEPGWSMPKFLKNVSATLSTTPTSLADYESPKDMKVTFPIPPNDHNV
jgi:hypothetical protein